MTIFRFFILVFFFQAEDGIRDSPVTGVQTCALPIYKLNVTIDELIKSNKTWLTNYMSK